MNERIRELAIEATLIVAEPNGFDPTRLLMSQQKFAQLIVKECVGIVAKRKDQAIDDDCNVDEAMTMAEMDLLDNFGVEE
jgi:hypothetical protein